MNDTWLMFKAAYLSKIHKHSDDTSFMLYSKGSEIFIDPGMYNYESNIYNTYLRSALSHNLIFVDGETYPVFKPKNIEMLEDPYKYVGLNDWTGYNFLYEGVKIFRTIKVINKNEFWIFDEIKSDSTHRYSQNFHLSRDVTLKEHNSSYSIIDIDNSEYNLVIEQFNQISDVSTKSGDTQNLYTMSISSNGQNKIIPTTSIQYNVKASSYMFVTKFSFIKQDELVLDKYLFVRKQNEVSEEKSLQIEQELKNFKIEQELTNKLLADITNPKNIKIEKELSHQILVDISNSKLGKLQQKIWRVRNKKKRK